MDKIPLPEGIEIVQGPRGARFKGPAGPLCELADQLRSLRDAPAGYMCSVGSVTLCVTEFVPQVDPQSPVSMPARAWNILASKFIEVATGWEDSPFDFGDCGYLSPPPNPDLGVELVGDPDSG